MIARRAFVTMSVAFAAAAAARADDFDPATVARAQELRVLLGRGDATPNPQGGFTFAGRTYRGTFTRLPDDSIVNTLRLEEYLYSVVPQEMPSSWPAAALQTQAVCARTYVLQKSNPVRGYDVAPSELDQVYGGTATESPAGRAAVDATTGSVLRFGAQFAQAVYSSCCGGHTESSADAWGGIPVSYLAGVSCTTCSPSPYYRWTQFMNLADLGQAFSREIGTFGPLQSVALGPRDRSGRVRNVELYAERGVDVVKGSTFRLRVGPRVLPSLLITKIEPQAQASQTITIEGGGLGHGVGLCQWGARGLALAGASCSDILRFYFPGTDIEHD